MITRKLLFTNIILLFVIIFCNCGGELQKNDFKTSAHFSFISGSASYSSARHFADIDGLMFIDLNLLTDTAIDKLDDKIPCGNPFMSDVYSIVSDESYLYCYAWNLQIEPDNANHFMRGIYKIDPVNMIAVALYEWDYPDSMNNNYSIFIYDDYVYYFEAGYGTNNLCRVSKDGIEHEQLTNNDGSIYTGFFISDNVPYLIKDSTLYKSNFKDLSQMEIIYDNVYDIVLYNGEFFCLTPNIKDGCIKMVKIKIIDNIVYEDIIDNICPECYFFDNSKIFYSKYDPVKIDENDKGMVLTNGTQGKIYTYDILTNKEELYYDCFDVSISSIYSVNENYALVKGNTNEEIEGSFDVGLPIEYYVISRNGEYILIENKTLALQGT